jgi:hypothetical protein
MADSSSGSPHTATATAMEDTLASVQRALALLHQLQCSVSAFQLPSQLVLLERLCVPPPSLLFTLSFLACALGFSSFFLFPLLHAM